MFRASLTASNLLDSCVFLETVFVVKIEDFIFFMTKQLNMQQLYMSYRPVYAAVPVSSFQMYNLLIFCPELQRAMHGKASLAV